MATYLMSSKLIHLLMDWETFNELSALEQVKGVIRVLKNSVMKLFAKTVNVVNLKMLIIPAQRYILDASLGPECASAGAYNIDLKVQT